MTDKELPGLLKAGKIVNVHGVRGEIKILPFANSPEFLTEFKRFYIDGEPVKVVRARVHKTCVIAALDGVCKEIATGLVGNSVHINRDDADLDEGRHFIADLIGLSAIDAQSGRDLGTVTEILTLPANDVYVIKSDDGREILVPGVSEFVGEINVHAGYVSFRKLE